MFKIFQWNQDKHFLSKKTSNKYGRTAHFRLGIVKLGNMVLY